jgi:hypothetical protein
MKRDDTQEIADAYADRWPIKKICSVFKCHRRTVDRAIVKHGVTRRSPKQIYAFGKPRPRHETIEDKIISLRKKRNSYGTIGRKLNVDPAFVMKVCHAGGLQDHSPNFAGFSRYDEVAAKASVITVTSADPNSDRVKSMIERFGAHRVVVVPPVETSKPINAPRLFIGDRYGNPRAVVLSP